MTPVAALAPDEVLDLATLLDARLSPDGSQVAYVVSTVAREPMVDLSQIWVSDVSTGDSRALTQLDGFNLAPSWSPDGRSVAYRAVREGPPQAYLVDVGSGDRSELTSLPLGVGTVGPLFAPDGESIAFSAPVRPPRDPRLPFRVDKGMWRLDGVGLIDDARQELFLLDPNSEPRQLTDHDEVITAALWSPDGSALLYLNFWSSDTPEWCLRTVDVASGATSTVWRSEFLFLPPAFAWLPDGRIVRTTPNRVAGGERLDLVVTNRDGTSEMARTSELDGWIFGLTQGDFPFMGIESPRIVVSPEGESAYVAVQTGGRVAVWSVALDGPERCEPVVSGERCSFPFDASREHLIYASTTMREPPELWLAGIEGHDQRRLTNLNTGRFPAAARFAIHRLEAVSSDGRDIEGWLLAPDGVTGPVPTILNNHGGPHAAWGHIFSFDNCLFTEAGYGVLLVNQRGSTGYEQEFATQLRQHWGGLDVDDLTVVLDQAVDRGLADPERLVTSGISAGAFLSAWLVTHDDRFKAAAIESPCIDWHAMTSGDIGLFIQPWFGSVAGTGIAGTMPYVSASATTYAERCSTPMLIIQHELDLRTPPANSDVLFTLLKLHGCTVEMLRVPGSSHAGSIELGNPHARVAQNQALLDWFRRYCPVEGTASHPSELTAADATTSAR